MNTLALIPGYESFGITTDGDIWSYEKQIWRKFSLNSGGYKIITIQGKSIRVHRLVAITFIPNPENKPEVNHIDGNKLNNSVSNLEWNTRSENQSHAARTGLMSTGSAAAHSKLKEEDVEYIRLNYKTRDYEHGTRGLARKFGVNHSTICRILDGNKWKYN